MLASVVAVAAVLLLACADSMAAGKVDFIFKSQPQAQFQFEGPVGQRVASNADQWLLTAPSANPGMLQMFRDRDRRPTPTLVPWAGEFAGKYLISAVQALRMNPPPELESTVRQFVQDLIATQSPEGYLGPFPKKVRLTDNWDLWGHYHCLLGLMMWDEWKGDPAALQACRRAADFACATFLGTDRRVLQAGSQEMNMAFIHGLGRLHRITREPRYLQLMREIEEDWKQAGDYVRTGLAGVEFFRTPRPRWESLPDLQGVLELHRATGEEQYRTAFLHHWRSILRWDRRNTGGFSSGEQATGDPYAPTAIETCCTVAWMALTQDALRLTGDPLAADELEFSTFNAGLGAQHPSGRWWTYNTPMDGVREASAHSVVFQARAGAPELNCCSVNGPRVLGMLSEWSVMTAPDGLVLNYYGPGTFHGKLPDNTAVSIRRETDYPVGDTVRLRIDPLAPRPFKLRLRIPAWSAETMVKLNNQVVAGVVPGRYLELNRRWEQGDTVTLQLDLRPRIIAGDHDAAGRVSILRGPLLLAWDQADNTFDEDAIQPVDLRKLAALETGNFARTNLPAVTRPWVTCRLGGTGGADLILRDFASAGAAGTRYRSWLSAASPPPAQVVTRIPLDGAAVPQGRVLFRWTGLARAMADSTRYDLTLSPDAGFQETALKLDNLDQNSVVADLSELAGLTNRPIFWKVTAHSAAGRTDSAPPASFFRIDPRLAASTNLDAGPALPPVLVAARLDHEPSAQTGRLVRAEGHAPADGPNGRINTAVSLDGLRGRLTYEVTELPEEDYSVSLWLNVTQFPQGRLGEVFSAWTAASDDPLRICVEGGKLFARMEAGQGYSTPGVAIQTGEWLHVAAVKRGATLRLYLDGKPRGETHVPYVIRSASRQVALGGNPRYSGPEFLSAKFADFQILSRALSDAELAALSRQ